MRLRRSITESAVRVVVVVSVTVGGGLAVAGLSLFCIFLGALRLYESLCCVSTEALTVATLALIGGKATDRVCMLALFLPRL